MKPKKNVIAIGIQTLVLAIIGLANLSNAYADSPSGLVSDAFDGGTLDSRWTFVDPLSDSSASATGTQAAISVPAGTGHDMWKNKLKAPRLLQTANDTDFTVEVKIDSPMDTFYQIAGIVVQQDANNLMRFDVFHDGSNLTVFSTSFVNKIPTTPNPIQTVITDSFPIYLRVNRSGDQWTYTYSYDSSNWQTAGTYTHALTVTQVGIFAGNPGSAPAYTGLFDYFIVDGIAPGGDTTAPVISNINVSVTDTTATLTWDTDEPADSVVDYGLTSGYGLTSSDSALVTSHSVTLTGLTAETEYHYALSSTDVSTNTATTSDATFTTASTSSGGSSPSGLVSDDFSAAALDGRWTLVDPVGDSSVSVTGSQAALSVPAGTSHDMWKSGIDSARIVQAANDTDFVVEVKFDSALTEQSQLQGLTVEQDGTNLIRFDFYTDGSDTRIFAASFANGKPKVRIHSVIVDATPLYLRVTRVGNQWTVEYSFDGLIWSQAGVFNYSINVTAVGISSGNAGSPAPAHTALADYFIVDGLPSEGDNVAPVISNEQVSVTETTATITWQTNEAADSVVDYGTDINYGSNVSNAASVTEHSLTLIGLTASTEYHFQISSTDASNNTGSSVDMTFTTADEDVTAPVISNINVSVTDTTATLTWDTDEPADSVVDYGLTSGYGLTSSDSALVTAHSVTLTGLTPNTQYHYEISSTDESTNTAASGDATFTTDAASDSPFVNWTRLSSATGDLPVPPSNTGESGIRVVDMDGDGQNDYVLSIWGVVDPGNPENPLNNTLLWYRRSGDVFTKYVVDREKNNLSHSRGDRDIDGDGDLDIIIGDAADGNTINWWENPKPDYDPAVPWVRREVRNTGANMFHDSIWGDFDGDGKDEFIAWNQKAFQLLLFEVPADPKNSGTWPVTQIFSWTGGNRFRYRGTTTADVNLDGKIDLVGGCSWFEHTGGTNFTHHSIDEAQGYGTIAAGQIIPGGRPEVVCQREEESGPLNMYEWTGTEWDVRTLVPQTARSHTLELGDINADGFLDILFGAVGHFGSLQTGTPLDNPIAKLYVLYGDGTGNFTPQTVFEGMGHLEGRLGDIDNDGDLDIVTKPFRQEIPQVNIWINEGIATGGDTVAPVISNVQTTVTDTTAAITWNTNELSSSLVEYGLNSGYGSTVTDAITGIVSHKLVLTDLTPNTLYHFQVTSVDSSDNSGSSADLTFTTAASDGNPSGLVSDHFNSGTLNTSLWSFDDPVGDSSFSMAGTQAAITVPAGTSHDIWENALDAPRIRQLANDTDFTAEIKFDSSLLKAAQLNGLTVEQDSTNFIRFDFHTDGSVTRAFIATFANGDPTIQFNDIIGSSTPLYMRVERVGNQWTMTFSHDGIEWHEVGVFNYSLAVSSVTIYGGNSGSGSSAPAYTSLIDYFLVED